MSFWDGLENPLKQEIQTWLNRLGQEGKNSIVERVANTLGIPKEALFTGNPAVNENLAGTFDFSQELNQQQAMQQYLNQYAHNLNNFQHNVIARKRVADSMLINRGKWIVIAFVAGGIVCIPIAIWMFKRVRNYFRD